jgi:hypothetical protein
MHVGGDQPLFQYSILTFGTLPNRAHVIYCHPFSSSSVNNPTNSLNTFYLSTRPMVMVLNNLA